MLDLMSLCCCPEILKILTRGPHFHFALGPASSVGPGKRKLRLLLTPGTVVTFIIDGECIGIVLVTGDLR